MSRLAKVMVAVLLLAIAWLVVFHPHEMLAPGSVQDAHRAIEDDCFACHTPLLGAADERCTTCHRPAGIGRVSTTGKPLLAAGESPRFPHDALGTLQCVRCHGEHAGVRRLYPQGRFDHARYFSLDAPHATRCVTCHDGGRFDSYTCYGCHEHRPDRIAREHREEGIRDVRHCARCHRGADEGEGEGAEEDD